MPVRLTVLPSAQQSEGEVTSAKWLFTFHGRLGRAAWWLAFLVQLIIVLAAGLVAGLVTTGGQPDAAPAGETANIPAILIMIAAFVVATWISLATSAKRLHDLGVSGWWIIPLYIGSTLGSAISNAAPQGGGLGALLLTVLGLALTFGPIIYLGAVPGQSGDNRFGPDPRAAREVPEEPSADGENAFGSGQGGRVESYREELRDLQQRLDDGAITQDEFDRKKKQILGI